MGCFSAFFRRRGGSQFESLRLVAVEASKKLNKIEEKLEHISLGSYRDTLELKTRKHELVDALKKELKVVGMEVQEAFINAVTEEETSRSRRRNYQYSAPDSIVIKLHQLIGLRNTYKKLQLKITHHVSYVGVGNLVALPIISVNPESEVYAEKPVIRSRDIRPSWLGEVSSMEALADKLTDAEINPRTPRYSAGWI